jgi:hypothetical protein
MIVLSNWLSNFISFDGMGTPDQQKQLMVYMSDKNQLYLSTIFASSKLLAFGMLLQSVVAQPVPPNKLLTADGAHQRCPLHVRHFCVDLQRVQIRIALATVLARVLEILLVHPLDVDAQHIVA